MSANEAVIRFEEVSKSFGSKRVLQDVSFDIARGSAFCILGRSGTGKSVTLKLMIGLLKPEQGRIFVEHQDITALHARELPASPQDHGFCLPECGALRFSFRG